MFKFAGKFNEFLLPVLFEFLRGIFWQFAIVVDLLKVWDPGFNLRNYSYSRRIKTEFILGVIVLHYEILNLFRLGTYELLNTFDFLIWGLNIFIYIFNMLLKCWNVFFDIFNFFIWSFNQAIKIFYLFGLSINQRL